jgi:SAM-dependent methyltransferase
MDDIGYWDAQATAFDEFIGETGDPLREHILDPFVLEHLSLEETDIVLDAGCGNGYFCRKLSPLVSSIIGMDFSEKLLAIAKEKSIGFENITYHQHDLTKANWPIPQPVTKILAHMILQDMPIIDVFFKECIKHLSPGSTLVVTIPHPFTSPPIGSFSRGLGGRLGLHKGYLKAYNYLEERKALRNIHLHTELEHNYYHRTISTYISTARSTGFTLQDIAEIGTTQEFVKQHPGYFHGLTIPIFLYLQFKV